MGIKLRLLCVGLLFCLDVLAQSDTSIMDNTIIIREYYKNRRQKKLIIINKKRNTRAITSYNKNGGFVQHTEYKDGRVVEITSYANGEKHGKSYYSKYPNTKTKEVWKHGVLKKKVELLFYYETKEDEQVPTDKLTRKKVFIYRHKDTLYTKHTFFKNGKLNVYHHRRKKKTIHYAKDRKGRKFVHWVDKRRKNISIRRHWGHDYIKPYRTFSKALIRPRQLVILKIFIGGKRVLVERDIPYSSFDECDYPELFPEYDCSHRGQFRMAPIDD